MIEQFIQHENATDLRYGENPHQQAKFIQTHECFEQIQGKELSYNNILDASAAWDLIMEFEQDSNAAAIIKHTNPCGAAIASTIKQAYMNALECDSKSAYGGIVAINQILDETTAEEIVRIFTEIVMAPGITYDARSMLNQKPNIRILIMDMKQPQWEVRSALGGFLIQTRDNIIHNEMRVVSKRNPTDQEWNDMEFAWRVVKHAKSNAIVYAKNSITTGIGVGQTNRVGAAAAALAQNSNTINSVAASDGFIPFPDAIHTIHSGGATAIIQPGGSIRDDEVIDAANKYNMAMVFTNTRHFKH